MDWITQPIAGFSSLDDPAIASSDDCKGSANLSTTCTCTNGLEATCTCTGGLVKGS